MNRSKNALRNIIFGILLKVYQIVMPFVMRTIILYYLGIKYLGLNGLFSSILSMLNLAELGVGWAMLYCMYEPIANDDESTICALMALYKKYYRVIGIIIIGLGFAVLPFLPNLVSEELPKGINIYLIFILNLIATVFNYWLFGYKSSLLAANQREDIVSKLTLMMNIVRYFMQIIVIVVTKNYYYFLIVAIITQILYNIAISIVVDIYYPNYKAKGKLAKEKIKEINEKVKDVFTSKLGGVLVNSADPIIISTFLGVSVLAIYQNYFSIITGIVGLVGVIFTSIKAGIGNSLVIDNREKVYEDFNKVSFISCWIIGWCSICLICLYQPFMIMWMGKELLLPNGVIILFSIYFFFYELMQLFSLYKDAAGVWHDDRFRPLFEGLLNLGLNIIMVRFWGLYGVLISTILSMGFFSIPWLLYNMFQTIFKRELKQYVYSLIIYIVVTVFNGCLTYFICLLLPQEGVEWFIAKGVICCIIPNIIFFILYERIS